MWSHVLSHLPGCMRHHQSSCPQNPFFGSPILVGCGPEDKPAPGNWVLNLESHSPSVGGNDISHEDGEWRTPSRSELRNRWDEERKRACQWDEDVKMGE